MDTMPWQTYEPFLTSWLTGRWLGYLTDGGQITLTVESGPESWKAATRCFAELDVHLNTASLLHQLTRTILKKLSSEPAEEIADQPEDVLRPPGDNDGTMMTAMPRMIPMMMAPATTVMMMTKTVMLPVTDDDDRDDNEDTFIHQ